MKMFTTLPKNNFVKNPTKSEFWKYDNQYWFIYLDHQTRATLVLQILFSLSQDMKSCCLTEVKAGFVPEL